MSIHSPKNPYRMDVHFKKFVPGVGSSISYTAESISELKSFLKMYRIKECHVLIFRNMETYLKIHWHLIEQFSI